ncbi:hypothetical protein FOA43_004146 [Brettanomyces nanus]|uniref:Elongator complex protein 2 n=1 Tax=Eeniella nana TaxID=13502 RepID=A0A875SAD8_EENNA|nr:uncharacterized protein FOA43_004146 [Brettanomyces nanus]QPG76752.1 hypothetical protein FOA43_004146 [Brettanomyces nanus]
MLSRQSKLSWGDRPSAGENSKKTSILFMIFDPFLKPGDTSITTNMVSTGAIFVGCNKELQAFDYNPVLKSIAYGAKNAVAITTPFHKGPLPDVTVTQTLKSHTKLVTAVKWLPDMRKLVAASEDGTVVIWSYEDTDDHYVLGQTLITDHHGSIECLAVLDNGGKLVVTGSANGYVDIWKYDDACSQFNLFGEFTVADGLYPLTLSLNEVAKDQFIIFIGGTGPSLYVYSFSLLSKDTVKLGAILPGHENWIKSLSVKKINRNEYLIASGSQDRWIRLWRLCLDEKVDTSDKDSSKLRLLSNKLYKFEIDGAITTRCSVNFDAIIMGHDDWISDLRWHPTEMKLLSSSADSSMMIWESDPVSGVWVSKVRLGEMAIKGASTATGSSGGFWSAEWIVDNEYGTEIILTNGKTGSFRYWQKPIKSEESNVYQQLPFLTGPTKDVTDVAWSDSGKYLLATSLDQTTRLFAKWTKRGVSGKPSWHEFARPQIHGYDMICIKPITETRFVSAGDEKVIRVFDEPRSVAHMLGSLTDITDGSVTDNMMPESASLPVLGLSNKAELDDIHEQMDKEADEPASGGPMRVTDRVSSPSPGPINMLNGLQTPPLEDHLQRHTLWPEIEKLYGHGFEVTTLDVSPDKKLIASACRSNVPRHAVIRIFRTDNWQQLKQVLPGHELTITRLRWSPEGDYLLSVSRDRQFSLWKKQQKNAEDIEFKLVCLQEKAHTRIIWDCCWVPSELHNCMFITGARDRRMKLWKLTDKHIVENVSSSEKLSAAVTALDTYPKMIDSGCLVAAGLDDGSLELYIVKNACEFKLLKRLENDITPDATITRVAFRPSNDDAITLAVGSRDNCVRIYTITRDDS